MCSFQYTFFYDVGSGTRNVAGGLAGPRASNCHECGAGGGRAGVGVILVLCMPVPVPGAKASLAIIPPTVLVLYVTWLLPHIAPIPPIWGDTNALSVCPSVGSGRRTSERKRRERERTTTTTTTAAAATSTTTKLTDLGLQ